MKLDRNNNPAGSGKYAIINLRRLSPVGDLVEMGDGFVQVHGDAIDFGIVGDPNEFFVIRLKDKYAHAALTAYADAAEEDDPEWSAEVRELASRSGRYHPLCKRPD